MSTDPNLVAEAETLSRSSVQLPPTMTARLDEIARRRFSTRSQVMREMLAEALDRYERRIEAEAVA